MSYPQIDTDEQSPDDEIFSQEIQFLQDSSLAPLKEDLVVWLSKTLEIEVTVETLMDVLANGGQLCRLAKVVENKATECAKEGKVTEKLPNHKMKCNMQAKPGSWFARDNIANFLGWCKEWGIKDSCLFETEDLVSHRKEKPVITCLLELARLGYKYGLEPPAIIKLEEEIEEENEVVESSVKEEVSESFTKRPQTGRKTPSKKISLDAEVKNMARKCHCEENVKRIREGFYNIFGKTIFIRLLNDRHLMVRVGGGWNTLQHYLIHHNPLQVFVFSKSDSHDNVLENVGGDQFLYIKAKYKS